MARLILLPFVVRPQVAGVDYPILPVGAVSVPSVNTLATAVDVVRLYRQYLHRDPENQGAIDGRVGKPLIDVELGIATSDEALGILTGTPPAPGAVRTMFDSVTAADIPVTATMVAGYVDGRYRWSDADWARFAHATRVRIAIDSATNDGHVLDVESGAALPSAAPGWARMRRAAGVDPSVYVNRSNWVEVRAAFQAAREEEPHYWLASWTGAPGVVAGSVATQYANPALSGGHYDLSSVLPVWPGVDQ